MMTEPIPIWKVKAFPLLRETRKNTGQKTDR